MNIYIERLLFPFLLLHLCYGYNFPWEDIKLTEAETANYPEIRFGNTGPPSVKECRTKPGDADWPTEAQWSKFNDTLGGVLLRPKPPASVCYQGPGYDAIKCAMLTRLWSSASIHADDPISISTQWAEGNHCLPSAGPNSTCTQGGYPVYVVNATTVRHVQMAVNFARNQNIRLVVKNTGHDFNGKSAGAHALSIWVHNLKGFKYLPSYLSNTTSSIYQGPAAAIGAGMQSFEVQQAQLPYNITMISPGGTTVGNVGGFMMAGGHSSYTSYYGFAADHILSVEVVMADGGIVTADEKHNKDLFWAVRGGGGGTFGVVTSVITKVFPPTPITSSNIIFATGAGSGTTNVVSREVFWAGIKTYWAHCIRIVNAGGQGYNFIRHTGKFSNESSLYDGLLFTTSVSVPNMPVEEFNDFVAPLYRDLRDAGITLDAPKVRRSMIAHPHIRDEPDESRPPPATGTPYPGGNNVGNTRLASRLFTYSNFNTSASLDALSTTLRTFVESGGYTFHGINYNPSPVRAGYPVPNNSILPAYRDAVMHSEAFESQTFLKPVPDQIKDYRRFQKYVQQFRDLAPHSGSYMNEGDAQEPQWRDAFWGANYGRLLDIKNTVDPYGVFYVPSGVGSERWEVRGSSGGGRDAIMTQDGVVCRT
ncbi:FAD binding domain-containing protein [Delitschia confertaspora ATCC 74209]|uniref:FAD binding domain-containing protein n=1 Tax=Delitschia confertaspora ATCC 74209 TaxID=1513339 RepID=A0A9P4JX15_9PLEO|nr:FAD binding domain-containing protein [Delitschia confertaspora ATCC 74209]